MKNRSEYAVYLTDKEGATVCVLPGEDIPSWAKIDNPFITGDEPVEDSADDEAPPRAGKGSGLEAWKAYADKHGVVVDDDADRGDIIAACEAAGVPV